MSELLGGGGVRSKFVIVLVYAGGIEMLSGAYYSFRWKIPVVWDLGIRLAGLLALG